MTPMSQDDFSKTVFKKHQVLAMMAEGGKFFLGRVTSQSNNNIEWYDSKDGVTYSLCGLVDALDKRCVLDCNVKLTPGLRLPTSEKERLQEIRMSYLSGDESQRMRKERELRKRAQKKTKKMKKIIIVNDSSSASSSSSSPVIRQRKKKKKKITSQTDDLKRRKVENELVLTETETQSKHSQSEKGSEAQVQKVNSRQSNDTNQDLTPEPDAIQVHALTSADVVQPLPPPAEEANVVQQVEESQPKEGTVPTTVTSSQNKLVPLTVTENDKSLSLPETGPPVNVNVNANVNVNSVTKQSPPSSSSSSSVGMARVEERIKAAAKLRAIKDAARDTDEKMIKTPNSQQKVSKVLKVPSAPPTMLSRNRIVINKLTSDNIRTLQRKSGVNQGKADQLRAYIASQRELLAKGLPEPVPDTCGKIPNVFVDRGYITTGCGTFQDILNGRGKAMDEHRRLAKKAVEEYRRQMPHAKVETDKNAGPSRFGTTPIRIATSRYSLQAANTHTASGQTNQTAAGTLARRRSALRAATVAAVVLAAVSQGFPDDSAESTALFTTCLPLI